VFNVAGLTVKTMSRIAKNQLELWVRLVPEHADWTFELLKNIGLAMRLANDTFDAFYVTKIDVC
jgi:hypothetical protein